MTFYRRELVDLTKDSEETCICVNIAGLSLVKGPYKFYRVKVDDSTEEGKQKLKDLLRRGYIVESIKTGNSIINNSTEEGRKIIEERLISVGINPKKEDG